MNTFSIKFTQCNMYVCHVNIYESSILTGERDINIRLKSEYSSRVIAEEKYNDIGNSDSENILCLSSTLKPVVFYLDGKYIRCNKTKKYISTFSNNRLLCGGAPLFLCDDNTLAVEFDVDNLNLNIENTNEKIFFWYENSNVYPRPGYPGKGIVVCSGGKQMESIPLIAYHCPTVPQYYNLSEQHYMVLEFTI